MLKSIIKNLPEYAIHHNYIVASVCGNNLWFYGAWDNEDIAYEAAEMIDGVVIENPEKLM